MVNEQPIFLPDFINSSGAEELKNLFDAVNDIGQVKDKETYCRNLLDLLARWIGFDSATLFEFTKNMQPLLLAGESNRRDTNLSEYLGGLYLIDPFYELFCEENKSGVFCLSLEEMEDYDVQDSYKRYWQNLTDQQEVGVLIEIEPTKCIHISMMFEQAQDRIDFAIGLIKVLKKTLQTQLFNHFCADNLSNDINTNDRVRVHQAVNSALSNFGADQLTAREREITLLLLKGHSAKSIARILDISPGTASIHRSNVYQKLNVEGRGDLFSAFIRKLTSQ